MNPLALQEVDQEYQTLITSQFFNREEATHRIDQWFDGFVARNLGIRDASAGGLKAILLLMESLKEITRNDNIVERQEDMLKEMTALFARLEVLDPTSEEFRVTRKKMEAQQVQYDALWVGIDMGAITRRCAESSAATAAARESLVNAKSHYRLFGWQVRIQVFIVRFMLLALAFGIAYLTDYITGSVKETWSLSEGNVWIFTSVFFLGALVLEPLQAKCAAWIYKGVLRRAHAYICENIRSSDAEQQRLDRDIQFSAQSILDMPNVPEEIRTEARIILDSFSTVN